MLPFFLHVKWELLVMIGLPCSWWLKEQQTSSAFQSYHTARSWREGIQKIRIEQKGQRTIERGEEHKGKSDGERTTKVASQSSRKRTTRGKHPNLE